MPEVELHLSREEIAELCHEANRIYCQFIGDDSQPAWGDAPDWQKDSIRKGVALHIESFKDGDIADPETAHNHWMELKLREGWRFGEIKDVDAKTHPCLLPYYSLPLAQQVKDDLFGNIVMAMMGPDAT